MPSVEKWEYKKKEKALYLPGTDVARIQVPRMHFFALSGTGAPQSEHFNESVEALYAASYTLKMLPKSGVEIAQYVDYTVYPLEGVWWMDQQGIPIQKDLLQWMLMIRQPDVMLSHAPLALERAYAKKRLPVIRDIQVVTIEEGDCVQCMHIGSYDAEQAAFDRMNEFCRMHQLARTTNRHRELYLNDPRKVEDDQLKTVLRYCVQPL